ncbi:MAG: PAS domain S-box protein [Bacteroidales bacterium]|nr:PAS domain S-box protein [Bacteroidales bacterium]
MKTENWNYKSNMGFIIVFALAIIILTIAGMFFKKNQEKLWKNQAIQELNNLSDFKVQQVKLWKTDIITDSKEIAGSPLLSSTVLSWLKNKDPKKKELIEGKFLSILKYKRDHSAMTLTDTSGNKLIYISDKSSARHPIKNLVSRAVKNQKEVIGDFYKESPNGAAFIDIAIPVFNPNKQIGAVLVFQIDPQINLFSSLNSSTNPSSSKEFFLFERKGDSVLFINNPKRRVDSQLTFYIPLSDTTIPAVKSVLHGPGTYEGTGLHNQKVLEVINHVKNSPWYLEAKIDQTELFAPVNAKLKILSWLLIGGLLFLFVVLFLIIQYMRRNFYKEILEEERKKNALKSHYEYVVKYANDIILLEDENLHIVEANQRAVETYQYTLDELREIDIIQLIAPEEREKGRKRLTEVEATDGYLVESVHQRKDGTLFDAEISARVIYVDGKKYFHQVIRDITDRKRAERALIESEERFRTTLYSTGDAIITTDTHGKVRYLNKVAENLIGWTENEAEGKPINEIFRIYSEDTGQELESPVEKVLRDGKIIFLSNHTNLVTRDGKEIPIGDSGAPIKDTNGNITGAVLVFRDLRKEREVRRALEESELHYRSLTDNAPVGIFRTRPDGYTTFVNPAWCQISGMKPEQALGDGWLAAIHPEDLEAVANGWKDTTENKKVSDREYRFLKPDGKVVYVLEHTVPAINSDGEINGFVGTITDITERKEKNIALKAALEKAQESDRLKTAFLMNMSHEIRTPMNGILGFIGLLNEPNLEEEKKAEFIRIINKSGERLLNTINDIIEISKIEIGDISLKYETVNLSEIMQFYFKFFSVQAKEKRLDLVVSKQIEGEAALIKTDRHKLDSILTNLLRNAMKFTNEGKIEFGNFRENGNLCFYVKDTGKGIPKEKLDKVFERFIQVDDGLSRGYEGSGLGLSIVKAYVEALDGHIEVDSEVGKGTVFTFTIPYKQSV